MDTTRKPGSFKWRAFLAVLVMSFATATATAQPYPSKPLRIIVPLGVGGGTDAGARVIAERLSLKLGQPVVVENLPGAEGLIGGSAAAKAAPDGYTMIFGSSTTMAAIAALNPSLPFDPVNDFTPVTLALEHSYSTLIVPADSRFRDLKDLIAQSKASPGKFTYGSATSGSRICVELLRSMSGADLTLIPYKTTPQALNDLIGGRIDLVCEPVATAMAQVNAGKARTLGMTSEKRIPEFPGVPTAAESGNLPGFEFSSWVGFFAPANTPKAIVDRLNKEIADVLAQPEMAPRMKALGFDVKSSTPEEFGALQRAAIAKYTQLVKDVGIKAN